ncbi:MAG: mycothiol synthase [Cryptosporangiaceae bacterium]|jgi:ribosomal protein S18 acetylase RimI-like enzyme|nr:mycothiol synthase [Cryptosporangiaceae bacterium]
MTQPPPCLTVRPVTLDDAETIAALIADVDLVDTGVADYGIDELREGLSNPAVDLPGGSWLGFAGDRLVVFAVIWEKTGDLVEVDHYVRDGFLDEGEHVLALALGRVAELARDQGLPSLVASLGLTPKSALAQGSLQATGWQSVRRHNVMSKPVSAATDPAPVIPAGVRVRNPEGEADLRIVHAIREAAFAEHYDSRPQTFEEWTAAGRDRHEKSLSWIASVLRDDGSAEDVGVLLSRYRDTTGWVRVLGVLAEARGRGIGTLLLRLAFHGFAAAGQDTVGLGVDTENVTGALAVYERAGMTRLYAVDTWKITVSAATSAELASADQ